MSKSTLTRSRRVEEGTLLTEAKRFKMKEGNVCEGRLLPGRHIPIVGIPNDVSDVRPFYQVRLARLAIVEAFPGGPEGILPAGEIIELSIDWKLMDLRENVMPEIEMGAVYTIHYAVKRLIKTGLNSGVWDVDLLIRRDRLPRRP